METKMNFTFLMNIYMLYTLFWFACFVFFALCAGKKWNTLKLEALAAANIFERLFSCYCPVIIVFHHSNSPNVICLYFFTFSKVVLAYFTLWLLYLKCTCRASSIFPIIENDINTLHNFSAPNIVQWSRKIKTEKEGGGRIRSNIFNMHV